MAWLRTPMIATSWLAVACVHAQSPLQPPFDLKWGDSPEKLIAWASKHSLDVTISIPADQPGLRVVKAQPRKGLLPGSQSSAVEGRFLKGRLYEVTEHFDDPELPSALFEARFEETRKQLAQRYGPLLANRQDRTNEDQFVTWTRSFHREPVKGLMLLLVYTELEDLLRKSKEARFSVVYRNENFRLELANGND